MGIVKISEIRIDGGTQPREAINAEVVTEYADDIIAGDTFPAVTVFHDGESYWLADGFHRLAAHKAAKRDEIDVDVRQGTRREAILHSVGANADHGYRRTNADKRRAVMVMLNDPEWSQSSDRHIARMCAVSNDFVSRMRKEYLSSDDRYSKDSTRTVTRGGTTYTQNTTNIGNHSKPKNALNLDVIDEWVESREPQPLVNLEGIPPEVYTKATQVGGTISRMADATHTSPAIIARGFKEHEKQRVVDNALKSIQWLEQFVQAMGGT